MFNKFWSSIIPLALSCIWSSATYGQTNDDLELEKQNIIEQRIEAIANAQSENSNLDFTNLLQDLTFYFEHPLDLNTAEPDELRSLYLINDIQISNLQFHIAHYGKLSSIFELQAVRGFDLQTIRQIQPFVTVDHPAFSKTLPSEKSLKKQTTTPLYAISAPFKNKKVFSPIPQTTINRIT